jgi:hypothetical protein
VPCSSRASHVLPVGSAIFSIASKVIVIVIGEA